MNLITLFSGQWADLTLETFCEKAKSFGYDGIELACWGQHLDVDKAEKSEAYRNEVLSTIKRHGLECHAISSHLLGQATTDPIDERFKAILPDRVWGEGNPLKVRERAIAEMKQTARVARLLGVDVVNGFTGSPLWRWMYAFPPVSEEQVNAGYAEFAKIWNPILDEFDNVNVKFALEVHPTEIAFDSVTAKRTLEALGNRKTFGFNFDPSHLGYQGVDYLGFIDSFADRVYHVHMKDVRWVDHPVQSGVFGGHLAFGDSKRYWNFCSLGRGKIDFESVLRRLYSIGYSGPLSVEWEDAEMQREYGATESQQFLRKLAFPTNKGTFEKAFSNKS